MPSLSRSNCLHLLLLSFLVGCGGPVTIPYAPRAPSQPVPAPLPPTPVSLLAFAYVENFSANTVSMFKVSPTGLWTPTSPATVPTGQVPESLVIDPSGRFVYVTNARDNTISQFVIDLSTGVLLPNTPATVSTGAFQKVCW